MSITIEQLARSPRGLVVQCLRNIGPYENNIFIVSDEGSHEGYVIDAGFEPEAVASAAAGLTVKGIIVTHDDVEPASRGRMRGRPHKRAGAATTGQQCGDETAHCTKSSRCQP